MHNIGYQRNNPNTAKQVRAESLWAVRCIPIVATVLFAPTAAADESSATAALRPEQHVVFSCDFGPEWDKNFDRWPDGWTRHRGPGYPHYLKIELSDSADGSAGRSLQVSLDGGAAAAFSPPIPVSTMYDYVLEGHVRAAGLRHNQAFLSLTFLDEKQQPLRSARSDPAAPGDQWQWLQLGPVEPPGVEPCRAVIGLHAERSDGLLSDLQGTVQLGAVRLLRVPRIRVALPRASCLFVVGESIWARCIASGLVCDQLPVHFLVEDIDGQHVASSWVRAVPDRGAAAPASDSPAHAPEPASQARSFSAEWELPELQPGYYYLKTVIGEQHQGDSPYSIGFAVLGAGTVSPDAQFGWTIERPNLPVSPQEMAWIVAHSPVGRLRCSAGALVRSEPRGSLAELLDDPLFRRGNRELVAMLDALPATFEKQFPGTGSPLEVLVLPETQWSEKLTAYVRAVDPQPAWWQIGGDTQPQLAGYPLVSETLSAVQRGLQQVNPGVRAGLVWDTNHPVPGTLGPPSCNFLALRVPHKTTRAELLAELAAIRKQQATVPLWVVLEPAPRQEAPLSTRATALVEKLVAARAAGAAAVFVPDVFDEQFGLLEPNGRVSPLFLVWYHAATLLADRYLGSICLPGGSYNAVFARGDEAVMVAWNDTPASPIEETLVLGTDVTQVDLWGRESPVESGPKGQTIAIGPLPTLILGLDPFLVDWRQQCHLAPSTLPSIPGQVHTTVLSVSNVYPREVLGRATVSAPRGWVVEPAQLQLRLLPAETSQQQIRIFLPFDTPCGQHPVCIDFELGNVANGRFRVFRQIDVQPEGLNVQITTHLDSQDQLLVKAELTNLVDRPISLRCHLFAPGRRRSSQLAPNLKQGAATISYSLAEGKDLLGQTLWLRAEQIGGPQVINYRFVASP